MTEEEELELLLLEKERRRRSADKERIARSQAAQDDARNSQKWSPGLSAAQGFADAVSPDPKLLAATGPVGQVMGANLALLREVGGANEGSKQAAEENPLAYGSGELGGVGVNAALGGAQAIKGSGAGAAIGRAAASGATKAGNAARALTELAESNPVARAAVGVGTGGTSEAVLAALKLAGKRLPKPELEHAAKNLPKRGKVDVGAYAAKPEATSSPVPELGKTGLRRVYDELVGGKKQSKAEDVDWDKLADEFDPGGADWKAWRGEAAPTKAPRPDLDEAAQVLSTETRVGRTPKPKTAKEQAIEIVTKEDVGKDAPKETRVSTKAKNYKPPGADEFIDAENAKAAEQATKWWKDLPLSPVGQSKPVTPTTPQLRAEARAAVARGESLPDLAKRLGLKKTDRELVAVFEAALIGN